MRITTKKCVNHMEMIEETYEVRVQIKVGQIITVVVDIQDGEIEGWQGKTKMDIKAIDKLPSEQRERFYELVDEMGIDE